MASIPDQGTASLAEGWEKLDTPALRHLRTVLSFRMMAHLKRNKMKEAENCRRLVAQTRAEINRREL